MFQLALGHVVLWLPCFVQVGVALLFTATPQHNNSGIFWLSIISSDIVFEVEAYKYKAVALAQLAQLYGSAVDVLYAQLTRDVFAIAKFLVFMSIQHIREANYWKHWQ